MPQPWEMQWGATTDKAPWEQTYARPAADEQQNIDLAAQGWGAGVNPLTAGAALASGVRHGISGNLGNYLDAYTMGPMHYLMGREPTMSAGIDRALREAKGQDVQLAQEHPVANTVGTIAGSAALGGLAAGPTAWRGAATGGGRVLEAARYLAANAGLGAATGALEGDTLADRGRNAALGGAIGATGSVVVPAVVGGAQAAWNAGKAGVNAVRQLATTEGRQGVAGQILREASEGQGGVPATSAITGLRPAQATGNRGIANLERTLAPPGVTNGMTSGQVDDVLRALPGYAEGATTDLLAQNSRAGVSAVRQAAQVLDDHASRLWQDPVLSSVRLDGTAVKKAAHGVIDNMPASWRAAFDSAEGAPLAAFRKEISELPANPTIKDVNAIVSRLRKQARSAGSGPNPDAVVEGAANSAAEGLLDAMRSNPSIAGQPANSGRPIVGAHSGKPFYDANGIPLVSGETFGKTPRPEVISAFDAARNATRTQHELLGYNEFNNILNPNGQGNVQADASQAFARFFTGDGGEGATRLSNVAMRLRGLDTPEARAAADALEAAAKNQVGLSIAHAGRPVGLPGETKASMGAIQREAQSAAPWLARNPMLRDVAPQVQEVGDTAAALMRPARSRGDTNSTTFEKLQTNQLINAIIGQSGASGLAAPAGAYAAYQWGPESVPAPARIAGGFAAGALAGRYAGPWAINALAARPGLRGVQQGIGDAVRTELERGLSDPAIYSAMLNRQLYDIPPALRQSLLSRALMDAGRVATPALVAAQQHPN